MRLLFASEATGWTGGVNQIWLTSQELIRRGHRVAVACRAGAEIGRRLAQARVEVLDWSARQDYDLFAAKRLAGLAKEWRADLLHAHHSRAHAMGLLAKFFHPRLPLLVTRRVVYPVKRNPFSAYKYRSRRVDRYVAVCGAAADELAKAGVERSRIRVIPSAIEVGRWERAAAARAGIEGRRPFVVTMVGNYWPTKGQGVLLKAAARVVRELPEVEFRFVGRDTVKLAPLAERLGIEAKVKLLGQRSDVPEILAETHLFALPSLLEGIGTALIEAQAAGVPAVASRVGGLPDVIEDGVTGILVPADDDAATAEAILKLLRDPALAAVLARRGAERVKREFSLGSIVDRLEALYKELAAR